jgi:hypothetical protein
MDGFKRTQQIKPDDIIIMSDADAFPSNVHVLNPLFSQRDAWVWQHIYSEESGFTFPMSSIPSCLYTPG